MILPFRLFRSKWVRLPLIAWGVYLVVAAAILFGSRYRTRQQGQKEVAAIVAKLDAEEPGWKWQDIEAARGPLPSLGSTSELPVRFQLALTKYEDGELSRVMTDVARNKRLNRRLPDETAEDLNDFLAVSKSLAVALEFEGGPGSVPRVDVPTDIVSLRLPVTFSMSRAGSLLGLDAERCCRAGNANAAVVRIRAMLNAERSIGSEPFTLSQLVRMNNVSGIAFRTERILALAEPNMGLADLQTELIAESRVDYALIACRGERAINHEIFLRMESGAIDFNGLFKDVSRSQRTSGGNHITRELFEEYSWLYTKYLPRSHAALLERVSQGCAACTRPEAEHPALLLQLKDSAILPVRENHVARWLQPSVDGILSRQMKSRARLRCAATAITVERFRQRFGRWPVTLAEIPGEILPAVPLDPFDGKPLKYSRLGDGVVVFSSEAAVEDKLFDRDLTRNNEEHLDLRFRLFDPNRRGLPPPPVPFEDFPEFDLHRLEFDDGPPALNRFARSPGPEPGPQPRIVAEDK